MEPIAALVALIEGSASSKKKAIVLKAVLGVLQGLNTHIHRNLQFVSNSRHVSLQLDAIIETLVEELKD